MNVRLLYIGTKIQKIRSGGDAGQRNWELQLQSLFKENFFPLYINDFSASNLKKVVSYLNLTPNANFYFLKKNIEQQIDRNSITIVFLCSSLYGCITAYIKKKYPSITVVTFFHNVEVLYGRAYLKFNNPKSWYFYLYSKYNEQKSVSFSDFLININSRDADELFKVYGKMSDAVIPYTMQNIFTKDQIINKDKNKIKIKNYRALFVGSAFFGNIEGLQWFVQEILPYLPIKCVVVGAGMDKFFQSDDKLEVYGFVDDLGAFYENTDFVILPIISGSGMKTKTAEAMMHGKIILGTTEAFTGYKIEKTKGLFCCNTLTEFQNAIDVIYSGEFYNFNLNIFNLFSTHYSNDVVVPLIKQLFYEQIIPEAIKKSHV